MSAPVAAARRAVLRSRVPGGVILLAAGLCSVMPTAQAALASSTGAPAISTGAENSCRLESGKAYCWGDNTYGELGNGKAANALFPTAVTTSGVLAGKALSQITSGVFHTCALDAAGVAYCWGWNYAGQLGDDSTVQSRVPVAVHASGVLAGQVLTQIASGIGTGTCALDTAGAIYCWGNGAVEPVAVDTGVLAGQAFVQVAVGQDTACALNAAGAAYCWGGLDSSPNAVNMNGVLAGKKLVKIAVGTEDACALDSAGAAYCWGANFYGQLGDGTDNGSIDPVAVTTSGVLAGKKLTQIAASYGDTCALDSIGAAYCWGGNGYGALGNPSVPGTGTSFSDVPVVVDASGVLAGKVLTQISVGYSSACATDIAGAAYCWGGYLSGGLGDDSVSGSPVPVLAGPQAPANVFAVSGGTSATAYWTVPGSLDGGSLRGYTATASPGGEACATTSAVTCTITGLISGATYRITVVVHSTAGDSGASASGTVTLNSTGPIVAGVRRSKCADDSNGAASNGTPVVMFDCDGSAEQNWTVEANGLIETSGKCMDIAGSSKANNAAVELSACAGTASQQWRPMAGALVNLASGKCLDDPRFKVTNGTQLGIYTCNGGSNQQWHLP